MITVLLFRVGRDAVVEEIDADLLEVCQVLVGGDITPVRLAPDAVLWCCEDAEPRGMLPNRYVGHAYPILGDFFVAGERRDSEGSHFCSLTPFQVVAYKRMDEVVWRRVPNDRTLK